MKIVSAGRWKTTTETFTTASWNGIPQPGITLRWGGYASLYERQLWVYVLVNKIAFAAARLPLKVYERGDHDSRADAASHPYAALLRRPHPELDPFLFWLWVESTISLYGEAFLVKQRDPLGRPVALVPWHPTGVIDEVRDGARRWTLVRRDGARQPVARRDLVHFRMYSPHNMWRGLSPLEALRSTLENEWAARESSSALWRNGARPSMILKHPGVFKKDETIKRLRDQVAESHGGASNWAKPLVLEEAMDAQVIQLSNEELQYIDARRLNREECCAAFDVPPPVVHILDRATFSNITEQMRSMYRDTMAPKLKLIESTLEVELRDGRLGAAVEPDFGDEVYAEFLMDEVLRGDFETRATAYRNADFMTIAEKRAKENLPYIEGTDRIFLNSASLPLGADGELVQPAPASRTSVPVRSLMGRLAGKQTLAEVNVAVLTAGHDLAVKEVVWTAYAAALAAAESLDQFKSRLRALEAQ